MKRFFYVCLILLLGFGALLTGCGTKTDSATAEEEQPNTVVEEPGAQEDPKANVSKQTILDLVAKGEKVTECSYDFSYTEGKNKKTSKCSYKDSVIRSEHANNIVCIMDLDGVTEYSTATRKGKFYRYEEYEYRDDYSPVGFVQKFMANPSFSYDRTENYDGAECYVIAVAANPPEGPYKAWVHPTTGLFVKIDGGQDLFEFKNVKTGAGTVQAILLTVPDDIVIE